MFKISLKVCYETNMCWIFNFLLNRIELLSTFLHAIAEVLYNLQIKWDYKKKLNRKGTAVA
jgi:hypothetical protein